MMVAKFWLEPVALERAGGQPSGAERNYKSRSGASDTITQEVA